MKITREQFETLALDQLDRVDRMARTLAANSAEADDLVQETYLRAFRSWESFDLKSFGIRPWLMRILHNLHATRGAREGRQPRATDNETLNTSPSRAEHPNWQGDADLERAMSQLTVELRTSLTLWAVDELSYQEIATVMEVPIGTVMSRLHRARQRLIELLPSRAQSQIRRLKTVNPQ